MKGIKSIVTIFLFSLISSATFAQTVTYDEVNTGNKTEGKFQQYTTKKGAKYSVGDKITFNQPSGENEKFVSSQKMDVTANPSEFGKEDSNKEVTIQSIKISSDGNGGYQVGFLAKGENGRDYYIIFIEIAENSGEIN